MTIKELEQTVGMTRANIRFYEQEGLLTPRRSSNGYRDYSPEDVETLERIKLLRRLHLDLDSIRALQHGELTLTRALERQLQELQRDQAALEQARAVCQKLRDAGTAYASLNPQPWLAELDRSPAPERFAPPEDQALPGHPWRRCFARGLDLFLYGFPLSVLNVLLLRLPPSLIQSIPFRLFDLYVSLGLMLLIEPLLLHFWGTTPGKALFGIVLRSSTGEKLTLAEARKRTWDVFVVGMGCGIPFYSLWREYKCYKFCADGDRCVWEWEWQAGKRAQRLYIPESAGRCAAYVAVRLVTVALSLLLVLQGQLPPRRGALDMADFVRNYNFYAAYLDVGAYPLEESGRYQEPPGNRVVIDLSGIDEELWQPLPDDSGFQYTAKAQSKGGIFFLDSFLYSKDLPGLLAFAGAQSEINALNFRPDDWTEALPRDQWNFDLTYRGVRITQTARFEGVEPNGATWVTIPTGESASLCLTFTVQLS